MLHKISSVEKIHVLKGGGGGREYQSFPSKIFCLTVPKISAGVPLVCD